MPGAREYRAPDITVEYDSARCVHFAECTRGLPSVFDVSQRPWIQPGNAAASTVAEVVERCPSGALHYVLPGQAEAPTVPTTITQTAIGQIIIRGDLRLTDGSGAMSREETRMSACGCGASTRRPFCDKSCSSTA
ncbi:hypothetical protein ELQ94_14035 [Labedella endophytica]|uniref:Divergent 4Fe-4S mono-cluster domain-containing protein n=1 Tax=Labedella endophytica TaxID=1523160 RepID=A0A3S0X4X8_9MICO|nr:hypothetical protein ELQ94_14035 [Labedella endophytica]